MNNKNSNNNNNNNNNNNSIIIINHRFGKTAMPLCSFKQVF